MQRWLGRFGPPLDRGMKVAIEAMKNPRDCSEIAAMGAISLMPDKLNSVQSNGSLSEKGSRGADDGPQLRGLPRTVTR
jgi:hypothetical protein